jgi:hypothetical protein
MSMKSEHLTGFTVGLGAAAAAYYLYSKNKTQVDQFLKEHGIELPGSPVVDSASLSLEQLILEKERLEDLIAEREMTPPESVEAEKPTSKKKASRKQTKKKKKKKTTKAG